MPSVQADKSHLKTRKRASADQHTKTAPEPSTQAPMSIIRDRHNEQAFSVATEA